MLTESKNVNLNLAIQSEQWGAVAGIHQCDNWQPRWRYTNQANISLWIIFCHRIRCTVCLPVLMDLAMCVRKRSWTNSPCTLSKLQLGSHLAADSQVSSKWLPLLAVSPLSPTCWSSLPTSHFSLMTLPALSSLLVPHSCSLLAGSSSVFVWRCPGQCCPLSCIQKSCWPTGELCLGRDHAKPNVWVVTVSALAALPLAFCHGFVCPDTSSAGKSVQSTDRGCPASPSHLSCAWLAAHSQPLCCAKSSHRDFWTDTLLSPALEHPLVLPVVPAYLHIIYGPALPASFRVSCTEVRESHTGCVHLSRGVWSVGCLCNHRTAISMENSSWWKGAVPLSPVPAGVSGAGSVAIPGLAFHKSVSVFFAESPVLSLCITMCCQASASESCGWGAAGCTLAGHFLLLLGLLVHPQWPGLG